MKCLREKIEHVFADSDSATMESRLDDAGIANARVNDMYGVWDHPQLHARNRWRKATTSAGAIPMLLPPGGIDGFERMDAVPALGENTLSILKQLGFDDEFCRSLKENEHEHP